MVFFLFVSQKFRSKNHRCAHFFRLGTLSYKYEHSSIRKRSKTKRARQALSLSREVLRHDGEHRNPGRSGAPSTWSRLWRLSLSISSLRACPPSLRVAIPSTKLFPRPGAPMWTNNKKPEGESSAFILRLQVFVVERLCRPNKDASFFHGLSASERVPLRQQKIEEVCFTNCSYWFQPGSFLEKKRDRIRYWIEDFIQ